jgi:hypothetical protein
MYLSESLDPSKIVLQYTRQCFDRLKILVAGA